MNCSDWEREIAGESSVAGLEEHLDVCEGCRQFAAEIAANRVALQELTVHPAALEAVRRRVFAEIQAEKRPVIWWRWAVVAAAALVILGVVYFRAGRTEAPRLVQVPVRAPQASAVAPAVAPMDAKPTPPAPVLVAHRRGRRQLSAGKGVRGQLTVKMLTSDPDVIIIWLVDQKGD